MKILQINAVYGYKSTGTIVEDIGALAREAGNETFFAYQTAEGDVPHGYQIGNRVDWKLHALQSRLSGKQSYFSAGATKKLIRYIREIRPDVVHLHNLHSNYIHLNMLLNFLSKAHIPTVITLHDCWYFTGKCFHYIDASCEKFRTGCGNCPKWKHDPDSSFFDRSAKVWADRKRYLTAMDDLTVVGCSRWIAGEAKKTFLREKRIEQIYNGVDTGIFCPQDGEEIKKKYGFSGKRVVLGMADKWLLPENQEVCKQLAGTQNGTAYILVGCNENQQKQIQAWGSDFVPVKRINNRAELAEFYAMADVFVNLTHADTLPTVNMESICCGTPVITYDVGGSGELVGEGCGRVISENDITAMCCAIREIKKENFPDCAVYGKLHFDKKICYKQYLQLYRNLVKGG